MAPPTAPISVASSGEGGEGFCSESVNALKRLRTCFTGTDTNHLFNLRNKNLAITDLAGLCRCCYRVNHPVD